MAPRIRVGTEIGPAGAPLGAIRVRTQIATKLAAAAPHWGPAAVCSDWWRGWIRHDVKRGVAEQIARPATEAAGAVVRVVKLAPFQSEAAASNALGKFVAQRDEQPDTLVEFCMPAARKSLPVALVGRPLSGERFEGLADLVQRQPDALGDVDEGQPAQNVAVVAPLVSGSPLRLDQPLALVKAEG